MDHSRLCYICISAEIRGRRVTCIVKHWSSNCSAWQLQVVWFKGHVDWFIGMDSYSNAYIIIRIPDDKRETHANIYGKIEYVTLLLTPTAPGETNKEHATVFMSAWCKRRLLFTFVTSLPLHFANTGGCGCAGKVWNYAITLFRLVVVVVLVVCV